MKARLRCPVLPLLATVLLLLPRAAFTQGDPVGPEFRVNTYTTAAQSAVSVAVDAAGNFIVVWRSLHDGDGYGMFGQRFASSGSPLGPEFRVNSYTTGTQGQGSVARSVAADAAGNFVVVWQSSQEAPPLGIFGQRFASSGSPLGPEFHVNSYTTGTQFNPEVAADPMGNFVVVWSSYDGSGLGAVGQRYASSGIPLGSEFRVNTYTTSNQFLPCVAADPFGNFVVVWSSYTQDGSGLGVFGQRYASSGAPLGPEFRVNTYTSSVQAVRSVAADSAGNFVIVWESMLQDGSGWGVFGQRYAASGVPLGLDFRVNTYTTNGQLFPGVATDAAGNFVIVWDGYNQDGSGYGVFGQRYSASGSPLGPEFRVNTYTTNWQSHASVAADAAGNFVVAWEGASQSDSIGIFGQRYNMIVPVELMQFRVD